MFSCCSEIMKLNCFSFILFALFELGTTSDGIIPDQIVTGDRVRNIEDFPYVFQLQYFESFICACSAIAVNIILTAGHCVVLGNAVYHRVLAGKLILNEGHQKIFATDVYKHPYYDKTTHDYNVAVLRLYNGLSFSARVQKVTLGYNYPPQENSLVLTAGWRKYPNIDDTVPVYGHRLRFVKMRILSRYRCEQFLNVLYSTLRIPNDIICTYNDYTARSVAQGDYGGPLMLSDSNIQIGVMSWGVVHIPGVQTPPALYTSIADSEIYEFLYPFLY